MIYLLKLLALSSMVLLPSAALSQPPSIEILQERCADKTIVMGSDADGKLIQTGERIGGYCAGFLEGVLTALEHEKLVCPKWEKDRINTYFLLSVLDFYAKEKSHKGVKAGVVVAKAFKRAFSCEKQ